jgi:neurofibromin 1
MPMALAVWEQQADTSVQYSIAVALSQVGSQLDHLRPNDPLYATAAPWKLTVTPAAMRTVANALLNARLELERQRMWAEIGRQFADGYVQDGPVRPCHYVVRKRFRTLTTCASLIASRA